MPTLAVLVAGRGPTGARLLPADAGGRLLTSALPYATDRVVNDRGPGDSVIDVVDATIYEPGQFIWYPRPQAGFGFEADYIGYIAKTIVNPAPGVSSLSMKSPIPFAQSAGDFFSTIPPPPNWLPPSPFQQPNAPPVVPVVQVGAGTTHMVGAVGSLQVYVFKGELVVTTAVANAECRLTDSAGVVRWRFSAAALGNHSFDLGGAPIGPAGTGLDVVVAGGAATVIVSAATTQA